MMPHTAGKTVAMYFGQPVANLREFLPDEAAAIPPPIKMGDGPPGPGEAPVAQELKHVSSLFKYLDRRRFTGNHDHAKQEA
jgi:hypothetical protein